MQVQLAIAKHMLDPHPCLGILPVDRFLLLAGLLTSHTALDDAVLHLVFAHHAFHVLSDIRAVRMQLLTSVVIVYQQPGRNGVVLFRTRGYRLLYQLALGIDLCVVLVAVIFLAALLRPSGICVFVPLLVGLFLLILLAISFFLVPKFVAASLLYGLVLLARVALAGYFHETAVYYHALIHYQILLPQELVKICKEFVIEILFRQLLFECPNGSGIGHLVAACQSEEVPKTCAVNDLIFGLLIAQIVHPLKHKYLEHQHIVVGLCSSVRQTLPIQAHLQRLTKHLEINRFRKSFQRISQCVQH